MARRKAVDTDGMQREEKPEVLSYAEQVEECFLELYKRYDVANAPEKRKASILDSFWKTIYKQVFEPDKNQINNCNSKMLPWDIEQVEDVTDMYVDICNRYGGVIKFNQFCKLVGYSRYTVDLWYKSNRTNRYTFLLNVNLLDSEILTDDIRDMILRIDEDEYALMPQRKVTEIIVDNVNNNNPRRHLLSRRRFDIKKKLRQEMQDSNTNQLSNDTMGAAIRANNEEELGKLYEPKRMIQHEQIRQALSVADLPRLSSTGVDMGHLPALDMPES